MSTYTMMDGALRIYESTDTLRAAAVKGFVTYVDSGAVFTDKSTEAKDDDSSNTGTCFALAADGGYVGSATPFARIKVDVATAAVGSGALVCHYYNGSNWTSEVADLVDGTASGGDTLAQDGVISFTPPADWAVGGNASLGAALYYVFLHTTTNAGTDPDLDQIWPVDGLYFPCYFDQGDLTGPEGRKRPEEIATMHRGRALVSHYTLGTDEGIFEPLEVSFTVKVDTVYNKTALLLALSCGNPAVATWNATGTSTKQDTTYTDGGGNSVTTPAFADSSKKAVCVQIRWSLGSVPVGREFNEVYFPLDQQSLAESEEGLILSCTGQVYGSIRTIFQFAQQW